MALRRFTGAVAIAAALCTNAAPVSAQEETPSEAVDFYREARDHYSAGRYREAAEALERALVLDPDSPTLRFNLARVYELLGQLDDALVHYQRYRRLLPAQQAREQAQAEATLHRLRGARASAARGRGPGAPPDEVEDLRQLPGLVLVRQPGLADGTFWTVLLTGAVVLAAGGVAGGVALTARSDADRFVLRQAGDAHVRSDLYRDATTLSGLADGLLAVGAATVVVAALLYWTRESTVARAPVRAVADEETRSEAARDARQPRLRPILDLGPVGASVGLGGAF